MDTSKGLCTQSQPHRAVYKSTSELGTPLHTGQSAGPNSVLYREVLLYMCVCVYVMWYANGSLNHSCLYESLCLYEPLYREVPLYNRCAEIVVHTHWPLPPSGPLLGDLPPP